MPTLTEQLNELAVLMEADPQRDAKYTRKANALANKIVSYVGKWVKPAQNISTGVPYGSEEGAKAEPTAATTDFHVTQVATTSGRHWAIVLRGQFIDPKYKDLYVTLLPSSAHAHAGGSMGPQRSLGGGRYYQMNIYVLPDYPEWMKLKKVDLKRFHKLIVHELIHYFDFHRAEGLHKTKGTAQYMGTEQKGKYYNDPKEFNAYYQDGANEVISRVRKLVMALGRGDKKSRMVGDQVAWNYNGFIKMVWDAWHAPWVEGMDTKFRRKFKARLYKLYQHIRQQVLDAYKKGYGEEPAFMDMQTAKGRQKYQQSGGHREWPMKGSSRMAGFYSRVKAPDPRLFIPGKG